MTRARIAGLLAALVFLLPACLQPPTQVKTENVRDSIERVVARTEAYAAADSALAQPDRDTVAADATSLRAQLAGPAADSRTLAGPLGRICDRHDAYVTADTTLTPLRRTVFLESTTQLRALLKPPG